MRTIYIAVIFVLLMSNLVLPQDAKDRNIILQIIKEGVKSYEKKDINKVMSSWSKKSPDYKKTKNELAKNLKELEDIKVTLSNKSPKITFKKNEATIVVKSKSTSKYIIQSPYKEDGDKLSFILKKDKDGKWKIVGMKMIKAQRHRGTEAQRHKEVKIQQKFKNKEEETIAKLSTDAINCISKKDIKCFLNYNNCSFPLGYIRCKFTEIMYKRMFKAMEKEEMKVSVDENKKINIKIRGDRADVGLNTKTEGKYKLSLPLHQQQTMTITLKKEHSNWKVWKWENVVEKENTRENHKH